MKNHKFYSLLAVFTLIAALTGGICGSLITFSHLEKTSGPATSEPKVIEKTVYVEESNIIDTVKKASPSVVSIIISKDMPLYRQGVQQFNLDPFSGNDLFNNFFNMPYQEYDRDENGNIKKQKQKIGGGSGFIISKDGLIVTNRHVVEDDEAQYTVITSDGKEFEGEVLAKDTLNDFAVIKIKDNEEDKVADLPYIELGDSDSLQIGQKVIAIGNALAEYQNTVTSGIISGIGRDITAGSMQGSESLINLIQTDAAINPGNSGGPLMGLDGKVIGINTAIAAQAEGIGFAIPINDVKTLIENVEENGKIVRPFLGVRFMMLDKAKADELKLDVEGGALLVGNETEGEFAVIPGSPAEKAGLKMKDVILEMDGQKIDMDNPLHIAISKKKPGDTVKMKMSKISKSPLHQEGAFFIIIPLASAPQE